MPIQAKFTLEPDHASFLKEYKHYGFSSKSELVRTAIEKLRQELKTEELRLSAKLYAEIYAEDTELQELTELGTITEWSESNED
jgi:Arc/MetJ-type ribon-helix-helix transcriptional regulator